MKGREGEGTGREACPDMTSIARNHREAQVDQPFYTRKALIHNNIEALLSVPTETVLKYFCNKSYLNVMSQVPG
jgi:hypothetical protein